jgi:hypothetical protein
MRSLLDAVDDSSLDIKCGESLLHKSGRKFIPNVSSEHHVAPGQNIII